jgi:hypothetical protein
MSDKLGISTKNEKHDIMLRCMMCKRRNKPISMNYMI